MKAIILIIFFCSINLFSQTLVGYWPFSGNTADSSGMGNNGTIVGNVSLTTDRCGNPNSAYLFNGGKITINSTNGFPTGNGQRTMCAWFKRNAVSTGTAYYIFSVGSNTFSGCRSSIDIDNVNTWVGVENLWPANYKVWQPDTNWHFLCAVFPQGSTVCGDYKVYFDGVFGIDTSRLPNTALNTNTEAPAIGCLGSANVYSFYGKIDEVRLYSTALNASQISQLYGAPVAPTLNSPANNSTGISLTPLLDWAASPYATNYRVQLSNDSLFATTQLDTTVNADSVRVPAGRLLNNLKYYWRVRASACVSNGLYSTKFNFTTSLVSINRIGNQIPESFSLSQNYPNPFNPTTKIRFDIPTVGAQYIEPVQMIIYNILGREIAVLVTEQLKPGTYEIDWDASQFSSGVYFYQIKTENFTDTKKLILMK